ncbi:MAG: hypothetical protein ISS74_04895 [Planctomycetes bacterium]|nr:hypothetical protein [Planctomycetota bacterium]
MTSSTCRNLTDRPPTPSRADTGRYRPAGLLLAVLGALALAAAGCGSGDEGPSDKEIRAEMDQVLATFQAEAKAEPEDPPGWFDSESIKEYLGLTGNRLVYYGLRMYADTTWVVQVDGQPLSIGLNLAYMGKPEGAKEAVDFAAPDYADTTALPEGITALRREGALTFAYGPYYVILLDISEMPKAGYVPRDPAKAVITAIKKTLPAEATE